MKVGQQVLSKIQNLLTQIDRKPKFFRAKPPPEQENYDDNSVYDKLYEDYKIKKIKQATKEQQKNSILNEELKQFKIDNKHTIFLNSQQKQKPIHQRLNELQQKKIQQIIKLKQKYPPRKQFSYEDDEDLLMELEERKRNQRKFTQKQANEKTKQLQHKQKDRQQRLNRLKIQAIQEHSKQYRCKPYVNKQSQSLWKRQQLKKQLSASVFQRFQQYQMHRKTHLQDTQKELRNKFTPFAPKISQNSRLLASRSLSRTDLSKTLQRSHSCKCFQKAKAKKHNGSTAMHSSRKL